MLLGGLKVALCSPFESRRVVSIQHRSGGRGGYITINILQRNNAVFTWWWDSNERGCILVFFGRWVLYEVLLHLQVAVSSDAWKKRARRDPPTIVSLWLVVSLLQVATFLPFFAQVNVCTVLKLWFSHRWSFAHKRLKDTALRPDDRLAMAPISFVKIYVPW